LLIRLRDPRDHAAWLEFVNIYEPVTYRLLRTHGLQDADAAEIMQELFLAVSRTVERWDPSVERGSFRGWLRRVARNMVINWLKQRDRRPRGAGGSDMLAYLRDLPDDKCPESAAFESELQRALFHRAGEIVRGNVQTTTWQAFWETSVLGASQSETAKKLGITIGAVRIARCRVLAQLKAAVAKLEEE
jgi:RNA polymerase sigma-70 factor (ECF subfamily)